MLNTLLREATKKSTFFSGPSTKALPPPPLLVVRPQKKNLLLPLPIQKGFLCLISVSNHNEKLNFTMLYDTFKCDNKVRFMMIKKDNLYIHHSNANLTCYLVLMTGTMANTA